MVSVCLFGPAGDTDHAASSGFSHCHQVSVTGKVSVDRLSNLKVGRAANAREGIQKISAAGCLHGIVWAGCWSESMEPPCPASTFCSSRQRKI